MSGAKCDCAQCGGAYFRGVKTGFRSLVAALVAFLPLVAGLEIVGAEEMVALPRTQVYLTWSTPPEKVADKFSRAELAAALLVETNRVRALHQRRPLRMLAALTAAAEDQAAFVALQGNCSHESPQPGQRTPRDRVERHGLEDVVVGENVLAMALVAADGPLTPQAIAAQLVEQWMNSPGHRANLLNRDFTHFGGAVYFAPVLGKAERAYSVQVFAVVPRR